MELTPRLSLPLIAAGQAQKHVTHNEAVLAMDALVQPVVSSATVGAPPTMPQEGEAYVLTAGASGSWLGQDQAIACFQAGSWHFFKPVVGWRVFVSDTAQMLTFDGTLWQDRRPGGPDLGHFGVNANADSYNRLVISGAASLFTHEGNGHQLKINKNTAADTGSIVFQTGYSGRAEMGLAGSDDWQLKTSADGATWHNALTVGGANGHVGINGASPDVPLSLKGRAIFNNSATAPVDENTGYALQVQNQAADLSVKVAAGPTNTAFLAMGSPTSALAQSISVYNGDGSMRFSNNGIHQYVRADGSVEFPSAATTASAANAVLDSATGNRLLRSTSSGRYKRQIEPLDPDRASAILALEPIWYRSSAPADNPDWSWYGFLAEDVAAIDPRLVHWGYSEEDYSTKGQITGRSGDEAFEGTSQTTAAPKTPRLKPDAKMSPQGVAYERFVVLQHLTIQSLLARIERLEKRDRT